MRSGADDLIRFAAQESAALRQAAIFRDLEEEDLQPLGAVGERRVYRRGGVIEGSKTGHDTIFVVVVGEVRVYLVSPEGRELTLFARQPGELFELKAIEDEFGGHVMAEATSDCTVVYSVPWTRFLEVVAIRPGAASSLATFFREGLLQERRLISELAFHTVRTRLAHKLAELAGAAPDHIIRASREDLAAMIGTRPEEVSRALRRFLDEQFIFFQPHGRSIAVLDMDYLSSY